MLKDIYGNTIIGKYNLNNNFVGKIIDLDRWEDNYTAKIYIKELMPSIEYNKSSIEETIYNTNIKNNQYSNKIISIQLDNGIYCKQVAINNQLIKPKIGDDVIVEFIDNDIKKPVFYNMKYTNYDNVEIIR